tara:strand:+ start:650 stop:1861 length:1212 start_codon:yes stop_codon:yes gene_type:complete
MKQKTLQEQYNQILKGSGNSEIFQKSAKQQFPNMVRNAADLKETVASLKHFHIITENTWGVVTSNKTQPDWFKVFDENMNLISEEEAKAIEKKTSKSVTKLQSPDKGYDYKDDKLLNNVAGEQFRQGYYTELTDGANSDKTKQELIDLVIKNITKNPQYYVEEAQFGVKGLGYSKDQPGLKPTQVKDAGKGGGYGEATKKDFPDGEIGTGYLEIKENKMVSRKKLKESLPLGVKVKSKPKAKKVKKETTDSKLAKIETDGRIATLEMQIEALDEIISSKTERVSMVSEDESLSELVDKKKIKEMQREIKILEKRKAGMEKIYEKMCGTSYSKKEIVDESEIETPQVKESTMPDEDILSSMKDELESYVDQVGNAGEAVDMYLENHPEDVKHKSVLELLADPLF